MLHDLQVTRCTLIININYSTQAAVFSLSLRVAFLLEYPWNFKRKHIIKQNDFFFVKINWKWKWETKNYCYKRETKDIQFWRDWNKYNVICFCNTNDKNIKPGDNENMKEDTQAFLLSLYRIDSQNYSNNRWEKYVNIRFNFY